MLMIPIFKWKILTLFSLKMEGIKKTAKIVIHVLKKKQFRIFL